MSKKVCMVLNDFPYDCSKIRVAILSYAFDICKYLSKSSKVQIGIISLESKIRFGVCSVDKIDKQLNIYRIGIRIKMIPSSISIFFSGKLINRVAFQNGFNVFHLQGLFQPFAFQKPKAATILTIHGMWNERCKLTNFRLYIRKIYYALSFRLALRNISVLLHNSEYSHKYFRRYKCVNQKVVSFCVPEVFFAPPITLCNLSKICFIGRVTYRKGIHIFVEAFSKLVFEFPNLKLEIIGSFVEDIEYYRKLQQDISKRSLVNNVIFMGPLNLPLLVSALDQCGFLVLPSFNENTPAVIVEAMARAKPVIASNVGGINLMIDDNVTGFLFKPGNVSELHEKMLILIKNELLRLNMSKAARKYAEKYHHIDLISSQLVDIYNNQNLIN